MRVEAEVTIQGTRSAVWAAIADIAHAAGTISGIQKIDMLHTPAAGLVDLRWRETRLLFGEAATVEKWITEAVEGESYTTRAEDSGFVFLASMQLADHGTAGVTLRTVHNSQPQGFIATLKAVPLALFFKGVIKKALLQDLNDIKAAVEQRKH